MSDFTDDLDFEPDFEPDDEGPVTVTVLRVVRESPKALLVVVCPEKHRGATLADLEEVWVPKSQIHEDSEVYSVKSGPGKLLVTAWLARQKGW